MADATGPVDHVYDHVYEEKTEEALPAGPSNPETSPELPLFDHDYCKVIGKVTASLDRAGSVCASSNLDR
jgi:hypothetical protein